MNILQMLKLKERGVKVCDPNLLHQNDWEEILSATSQSGRRKVYSYLFKKQMIKLKAKTSKELKNAAAEKRKAEAAEALANNTHIVYGLGNTTLFSRIQASSINKRNNFRYKYCILIYRTNVLIHLIIVIKYMYCHFRLMEPKQFGPRIIMDCSYDANMKRPEAKNTAQQIVNCFSINRKHPEPFDMHICGADFSGLTMKYLQQFLPTLTEDNFPLDVHTESVAEVFPCEKLVYLTPHCENDLEEFNYDDIYIIGGLVDKHHCFPVSLEKATAAGLRMAKLPLERYFHFDGDKTLTLDQVLRIMLDLKSTGSWHEAFMHLPKRKIVKKRIEEGEE